MKKLSYAKKKRNVLNQPSWCKEAAVGKLLVRCRFCTALHFENELPKCCDRGQVKLNAERDIPELLCELFQGRTDRAKRHFSKLARINTLFAFAGKSCTEQHIPGRGVPILKVQGSYAHTVASVNEREGGTPRFGTLYALDSMEEATNFRLQNERVSEGIDEDLLQELAEMFAEINAHAMHYKHMKDVVEK